MIEVRQTDLFSKWLNALSDIKAVEKIATRIARIQTGLFGDVKSVGGGVSELRIDFGPGYRLYFTRRGIAIVILLCGGDKSTQSADIRKAQAMAKNI
ncbi:MAG TPA: type II toxin-antitoxin system RelE/ParE family toxin [Reyranellaceae bacterium]|nr:type II toxin-antitoxin system RelE/ParE family toxin [Reyranellaceae bacterium]